MVLICISLMISDIEHLFKCPLVTSMSSLEKSIQVLCPLFNWAVFFFWCLVLEVLCKFWILTPYQMYWWICSPILWVFFLVCRWFPLLCKNFLVWCSPTYLFFFFCFPCWGDILDIILQKEMSEILLPIFLLQFLWFQV